MTDTPTPGDDFTATGDGTDEDVVERDDHELNEHGQRADNPLVGTPNDPNQAPAPLTDDELLATDRPDGDLPDRDVQRRRVLREEAGLDPDTGLEPVDPADVEPGDGDVDGADDDGVGEVVAADRPDFAHAGTHDPTDADNISTIAVDAGDPGHRSTTSGQDTLGDRGDAEPFENEQE